MPLFRRSKKDKVDDKPKRMYGRLGRAYSRLDEVKERMRPRSDEGRKIIRMGARKYVRDVQGRIKIKRRRVK